MNAKENVAGARRRRTVKFSYVFDSARSFAFNDDAIAEKNSLAKSERKKKKNK